MQRQRLGNKETTVRRQTIRSERDWLRILAKSLWGGGYNETVEMEKGYLQENE